jgi:hypothetical protein
MAATYTVKSKTALGILISVYNLFLSSGKHVFTRELEDLHRAGSGLQYSFL